jgi:hypothetical protein
LAPSDFYLFGALKRSLAGQEFESIEELLLAVSGATDPIGLAGFESVFDAWERRLRECIEMKGEYIAECESKCIGENPYSHRQTKILKKNRAPYMSTLTQQIHANTATGKEMLLIS